MDINKKNLYQILELHSSCTQKDIKIAYTKLALKYHPDKNMDKDTTEKFRDIQMAYEILYDKTKREEYDNLNLLQQSELYDLMKQYFEKQFPSYAKFYKKLIKKIYDNESDFKLDVNNLDIKKIFDKITSKMDVVLDICVQTDNDSSLSYDQKKELNLNINKKLITSLKNKYLNKYSKIIVARKTKEPLELYVPLRESIITYKNEGEIDKTSNIHGDLIINIICENETDFIILDNSNLLLLKEISLYEFLYGGNVIINHMDEKDIEIKFTSFIDCIPIICIKNKGLPKCSMIKKHAVDTYNNIEHGDLYVKFKIKNIDDNSFIEKIKNIY